MYGYFLYETDKFNIAERNRRAEIYRMVSDARRERRAERRADRQLSARPLRHLLPAVLTGSRR
jgi:hypothetical protein